MFKFNDKEITKDNAIDIIFTNYKENIINNQDDELLYMMIVHGIPIENWSDNEIQEYITYIEAEGVKKEK